jgi:sporulation protein YlmC with PRC-barrel domain
MTSKFLRNAFAGAACALAMAGVHAQAASSASAPSVPKPVAGRAILGVTIAEMELVTTGYRASKMLHQEVFNEKNEKIGKIDDLIVSTDGTLSIAVVNVGGFLGIAKRLVAIPVRQFAHIAPKAVLPNATKDSLKALPPFEYVAG